VTGNFSRTAPGFQRKSLEKLHRLGYCYRTMLDRPLLIGAIAALGLMTHAVSAPAPTMTQPQIASAVCSDSFTIPSPGEFFAAIGKVGQTNWSQLVGVPSSPNTTSRAQISLALGVMVTDGYIAVEAQDGQSVKNLGKENVALAKKLNVSESVLGRGNSIGEFAEGNDWNALREELEATQNEVKLSMGEQKDQDLVILVTLGAWIRGIDVTSGLIDKTYTAEAAQLLRQPAVVDYLLSQMDRLPDRLKGDPLVADVRESLRTIGGLAATTGGEAPSAEAVSKIHSVAERLVSAILGKPATPKPQS